MVRRWGAVEMACGLDGLWGSTGPIVAGGVDVRRSRRDGDAIRLGLPAMVVCLHAQRAHVLQTIWHHSLVAVASPARCAHTALVVSLISRSSGDGRISWSEFLAATVERQVIHHQSTIWAAFCDMDLCVVWECVCVYVCIECACETLAGMCGLSTCKPTAHLPLAPCSDGDGYITVDEVKAVLKDETEAQIAKWIAEVDRDGDGRVSYEVRRRLGRRSCTAVGGSAAPRPSPPSHTLRTHSAHAPRGCAAPMTAHPSPRVPVAGVHFHVPSEGRQGAGAYLCDAG